MTDIETLEQEARQMRARMQRLEAENAALLAELEALRKQKPVAWLELAERAGAWFLSYSENRNATTKPLYAAPVPPAESAAPKQEPADRDRWHIESLTAEIKQKNEQIAELEGKRFTRFANEDCWIFQGDGSDSLESLACPVVISPEKLRELLATSPPAESAVPKQEPVRVFTNGDRKMTMEGRQFSYEGCGYIQDNNFDFDAGLMVALVRRAIDERKRYAEMICAALNAAPVPPAESAAPDGWIDPTE